METCWACEPEEVASHPFIRLIQATRAGDSAAFANLLTPELFQPARPVPRTVNPLAVEACLHRQYDILETLLERDPTAISAVDIDRAASLLHISSSLGDVGISTFLLNKSPDLLRAVDLEGLCALHYAALEGRRAILSLLLNAGAEVNARSGNQSTALLYAAASGHEPCVELLISNNADVVAADVEGRTALHAAAAGGFAKIVRRLLQAGANPALADIPTRRIPLHWAAISGSIDAVAALLEGANLVAQTDAEEETPLLLASRRGSEAIVELLLRNRAAVDAVNRHGISPLMAASLFGHVPVMRHLLQSNASVAAVDPILKRSALHHAALGGQPESIRVLLEYRASPAVRDAAGSTPEDLAAGDAEVLAALNK